jgi:hypothetical protein
MEEGYIEENQETAPSYSFTSSSFSLCIFKPDGLTSYKKNSSDPCYIIPKIKNYGYEVNRGRRNGP